MLTVADATIARRLPLFLRARLGTHLAQREVRHEQALAATWHVDAPPLLDIDGELRVASAASVRIECLPGALRVAGRGSGDWG